MTKKFGLDITTPIGLAGASIGFGQIGSALDSKPLQQAGETTGKFIAPAINITMGGYLINQLRGFKKLQGGKI